MSSTPAAAYQVTTPQRTSRPSTTQQPARYRSTSPFRAAPPPPPSLTTQPASYYKSTSPFRSAPSLPKAALPVAKFLSKVPKGGGAALAIAFELFFPPPAGDNYYDRNPKNPIPLYKFHPPEPSQLVEPPQYEFRGGQSPGTYYRITLDLTRDGGKTWQINYYFYEMLGAVSPMQRRFSPDGTQIYYFIIHTQLDGTKTEFPVTTGNSDGQFRPRIGSVTPLYGGSNTGDPPPSSPGINSSSGNGLGAPSAAPPSAAPSPAPKSPPSTTPPPFPGSPGTNPGDAPQPKRHPGPIPSPAPTPNGNPGDAPQPERYPSPFPSPSPAPSPTGDPGPAPGPGVEGPAPNPTPAPASSFRTAPAHPHRSPVPVEAKGPGSKPTLDIAPAPAPSSSPTPIPFTPNPNTGNPEPKAPPLVTPNRSPDPKTDPNEDLGKQIGLGVGVITTILAGITALVQPAALQSAANAGTCQAFAPGGCAAPVANNAATAAANSANNGTALASIMAFLQALQTFFLIPIRAGVELINTKLGPVMSGLNGIGGFLSRTAEAAKIDKVLGAMNTVLLLHNAAMLSRNLGSTLGDLTSQGLATIGIKDSEGAGIDVNEILGKQANNFMSSLLGAEVWAGTKTSWNKASSIISSATNLMYTVRSMFDSTREIMEWTAENTGKIGNALKRFRVVGENAYKWLPERVTVQNRFTQRLDRIREGTDSLDDAASSLSGVLGEVQSIQQEYADLQEQKQKFDQNISELTPKTREENKPVTDAVTAAKTASAAPTGTENVFRGEGEKLDA